MAAPGFAEGWDVGVAPCNLWGQILLTFMIQYDNKSVPGALGWL